MSLWSVNLAACCLFFCSISCHHEWRTCKSLSGKNLTDVIKTLNAFSFFLKEYSAFFFCFIALAGCMQRWGFGYPLLVQPCSSNAPKRMLRATKAIDECKAAKPELPWTSKSCLFHPFYKLHVHLFMWNNRREKITCICTLPSKCDDFLLMLR